MSTSLFAYLNGSDIGNKVRLNGLGLTSRADGSVGVGGIEFDDYAASLTVRGWMSVIVKETACTAAPVLFTGYIADRTYTRVGQAATYKTGAARFINANLIDQNSIMHVVLITGTDGKRPAENQSQRINWITGSAYWPGTIDTSLVDVSVLRPFEAADYRGQYADDVLNDIAGPIFRTFFIYPVQTAGNRGLFFDTPAATTATSTLTLSNVLSDKTATCFLAEATLMRDPSEVYAKIRYVYANGVVIENLSSTRDTFFLDNGLGYRGLNINNSRVGVESTARSMADLLLTRDSGEGDKLTVNVQLPPASVGLIDAGQRIGVRFTHLPGFDPQVFTRVISRTIQQTPGNDQLYDVTLELSIHGLSSVGGGGAPGPGVFPAPPPATANHWWNGTFSFNTFPAVGGGGSSQGGLDTTSRVVSANTAVFVSGVTYSYNIAVTAGPATGNTQYGLQNLAGTWNGDLHYNNGGADPNFLGVSGSFLCTVPGEMQFVDGNTHFAGSPGTESDSATFWIDPVGWDTGGGPIPPQPGQWVYLETPTPAVDGTTVSFATAWPFADGSLTVYVDLLDQTAAITAQSGSAGTFTLGFAPKVGEKLQVTYQGR